MIAGELEDVGVHHENEQVAGETDLELEIAPVGELKNKVAAFLAIFLLKGGDNGARGVAEKLERSFAGAISGREKQLLSLFATMTDSDKEKLLDYAQYIVDSYTRPDKRRPK